ncbi:DUF4339 domain-containing protein, partial [Desulfobacterales bacterium HSG16]|nr:DUF4339 domain-containing protein [Desulfobacterales bacterium HSG16]
MSDSWYLSYSGKQIGPFDKNQALFKIKQMGINGYAWKKGYSDWIPIRKAFNFSSNSQSDQKNKGISKGAKLTFNYSVFPDPLPPKQNYPSISADERPGRGCLFTLGIIFGVFAGVALKSWLALFAVVSSFLGIESYLDNIAENESLDRKIKDWEIQKKKDLEKEAYQLSIKLNGMLRRSENLVIHDLPGALINASEQIEIAKKEYNANAYSPFWDCIENAVKKL